MKQSVFLILFIGFIAVFPTKGQDHSTNYLTVLSVTPDNEVLFYRYLVDKFYVLNKNNLFWMHRDTQKILLRQKLADYINSSYASGLIEKKYHLEALQFYADATLTDTGLLKKADRLYTDAAIALCKDLYHGYKIEPWVGYDQLSVKYAEPDNEYLLQQLLLASSADKFQSLAESLEPSHTAYIHLKEELKKQLQRNHQDTVSMLQLSMNYYRWIHHYKFQKLIVINLPEARLRYYENDSLLLNMKTVVGKTSTPTPRFATVCDQVILYPYWYVPRSIIFNEYLPRIKKNPSWIDANNMQVIDGTGKVMDHLKMNWASFHAGYFPYTIRQSTGCDNALGVLKFNIISPYGVYLHDTNNKTAFLSGLRYYSHGCIRIEEPFALGNKLLQGKLDTAYLQACFKEKRPEIIQLEKPIPIFSVYMQAVANNEGKIHYYKDIYKLRR
jgi:murein L,D-transpeptidase YcbB/YkuD